MAYSANGTICGVDFSVNGYSEKLAELMFAIVKRMVTLVIDPARFPLIKDQYVTPLLRVSLQKNEEGESLMSHFLPKLAQRVFQHPGEQICHDL